MTPANTSWLGLRLTEQEKGYIYLYIYIYPFSFFLFRSQRVCKVHQELLLAAGGGAFYRVIHVLIQPQSVAFGQDSFT